MKRTTILLVASATLAVAILLFAFFGCSCWKSHMAAAFEGFETEEKASPAAGATAPVDPSAPLTAQEKELFEDLKNNKLNEEDIKTLVQNNILNEKMVEKFLNKLASSDDMDAKEDTLEGFTSVGNTFACASFGADQ